MIGFPAESDTLVCPTCGARQAASAFECRRCRCDLSLVQEFRQAVADLHRSCLELLASGRPTDALACAQQRLNLCPDQTSRRLVAVTLLCLDRFDEATQVYGSAPSE